MKKGSEYTGKVIRMDFPNKGIVDTGEGLVKVACAMPGQTVRIRIKKSRNGSAEGILLDVIKSSDEEIKAECPHFGRCGGCLYQTYSYESELKIKESQVHRLLDDIPGKDCRWDTIIGSPVYYGYRNKMEYTFGDECKGGALALGLHRRRSMYDIENVTGCLIADADYGHIIDTARRYFYEKGISYYHRVSHIGYLRHLLVRRARSGEILIGLVTSSQEIGDRDTKEAYSEDEILKGFVEAMIELEENNTLSGHIAGIIRILNDSLSDAVKADRVDLLYGREHITESLLGLSFKISPFSFFQTNTYGAEILYSKVIELVDDLKLSEKSTIYDLYCGTGTITQIIAGRLAEMGKAFEANDRKSHGEVIGVEIVSEAVDAARENARINGLDNCSFIAGDVFTVLDELTKKPDLIILDPPRDGIHPKALPKILSYGVENIIYISCKPTSLARDLVSFMAIDYEVKSISPIDQFPRTGNIEVVVSLTLKNT